MKGAQWKGAQGKSFQGKNVQGKSVRGKSVRGKIHVGWGGRRKTCCIGRHTTLVGGGLLMGSQEKGEREQLYWYLLTAKGEKGKEEEGDETPVLSHRVE